jgi:hypothetical protein
VKHKTLEHIIPTLKGIALLQENSIDSPCGPVYYIRIHGVNHAYQRKKILDMHEKWKKVYAVDKKLGFET